VQEIKYFTPAAVVTQTTATGGTLFRLTDIAQGDDIGNRSGDMISMKELRMKLNTFDTNATVRSTTVRLIIFSDSMGSGSAVGITELLNTAANYSQYTGINRQRHRFKIFYDDYFSVIAATNYQERPHNIHFLVNQKRYFNDSSATAANIGKNALYLLVLGSTTNVTFDFAYQLTYTDS
jgi:hypothetical protein